MSSLSLDGVKPRSLSKPQFPILEDGDKNNTHVISPMATVSVCPQQPLLLPAVLSELFSISYTIIGSTGPTTAIPPCVLFILLHSHVGDGGPQGKEHGVVSFRRTEVF